MKLMSFTIWIIGISLALVLLCVGYFQFYQPNMTEARYNSEQADKLAAEGAKLASMKKKVQEAIQLRTDAVNTWQEIVMEKTPPTDLHNAGIDLSVNRYQLTVDVLLFRNRLQEKINHQIHMGGVKVLSGPVVPDFPSDPSTIIEAGFGYPTNKFPVRVFDFGRVRVQGTREQIRENVEGWTRIPNLIAVADGLTIEGTSPTFTATYTLSVLMYVRAKDVFPPLPSGASNGGGANGGNGATNPAGNTPAGGGGSRGPIKAGSSSG